MKKIIKKLKYLIVLLIGFFIVLIFKFISFFRYIRFGNIYTARVGHLCHTLDAYLSQRKKNDIAIVGVQKKISNKFILDGWKKKNNIYFSQIGFYGFFFLETFFPKSKMIIKTMPNYSTIMLHRKNFDTKFLNKKKVQLKKRYKINKYPFICFHNRDNAYLESIGGDGNDHNYRNFNINDYRASINFVTSKNLKAIRLGRVTNQYIAKIENKNYMQFVNKKSNDFTDIFLIDNCEFLVATVTGLTNIASILRKKIILVNTIPFSLKEMYQYTKGSIFLPKKIYSVKKKRMLKFCEIERLEYNIHEKNFLKKRKLRVINNTQEEILLAVKEMMKNYKINKNKIYKSKLHDQFWNSIDDQKGVHIIRNKLNMNISDSFIRKNRSLI